MRQLLLAGGALALVLAASPLTAQNEFAMPHLIEPEAAAAGIDSEGLSDAEIEAKFRGMAEDFIGKRRCDALLERLWHLEKLDDVAAIEWPERDEVEEREEDPGPADRVDAGSRALYHRPAGRGGARRRRAPAGRATSGSTQMRPSPMAVPTSCCGRFPMTW